MLDFVCRVFFGIVACVGIVHIMAWVMARWGSREVQGARIFAVGGDGRDTGRQMAAMYASLQWEANPARQIYILYDAGLDEQGIKDCETLAQGSGALFVRNQKELDALLRTL